MKKLYQEPTLRVLNETQDVIMVSGPDNFGDWTSVWGNGGEANA